MSEISIKQETNVQENDIKQTTIEQIHILDEKTSFALNLHSLKDIASNENLKKIYSFLSLSDEILEIAHSKGKTSMKSEKNLLDYYTLIKSSLNCLFKILTNCNNYLNSELEILIYYKISKLLFDETESLDLASEYINKALSICSRKNLTLMTFQLELLNFQIQYKTDKKDRKPALNYLNRIINKYKDLNLKNFELLLIFFKFQYFGMTFNPIQCVDTLRQISNEIVKLGLNQYNIEFYQLCLIYEISQHLLRGSIVEAKSIIKLLKNCQDKFPSNTSSSIPIQFITICELLEFAINIQENDLLSSKEKISKIDSIVKILKSKNYSDWYSTTNGKRENGKIIINLMINDPYFNNNNNNNNGKNKQLLSFPIEVKWLTPSEFRLTAFLYCGVCYISKSWDGKDRTEKLFDYCRTYIDDELKTENHQLSNIEAETKILRLNYISTLLDYYECLANFQKDKWNLNLIKENNNVKDDEDEDIIRVNKSKRIKISHNNYSIEEKLSRLEKFVKNYDTGGFSSQELVIYHNLIIKIYYLLGMNSQHLNKLSEAKYYYMKTRKLCSSSPNELNGDEFFSDEMYVTFKQSTSGISGSLFDAKDLYNQIYCLSTLNLIIIISYEAQSMKNRLSSYKNSNRSSLSSAPPPHNLISNYEKILSIKNILTREVINMLKPQIKAKSFVDSDFMFEITIEFIIKYIIKEDNNNLNNEIKLIDNLNESQLKKIKNISPFLLGLINYHNALSYNQINKDNDKQDKLRARNKVKLFKESIDNFSKYQNLNKISNKNDINSLQFIIFYINTKILETIKFYETDFTKDELENQELLLHDLKLKLGNLYEKIGDCFITNSLLNGTPPPKLLATSFNDKENDQDIMKGSSSPSNKITSNFQENSSPYKSTDEKRGNIITEDEIEEDGEVIILSSRDFRNKSDSPIFRTPTKIKNSERKRKYSFGSSPLKKTIDKPNLQYHNDNNNDDDDDRQNKHGLIINRSSSPAIENVIDISSEYTNNANSNDPYSLK
ncbi:hypothetical protein B5S29_g965 [[Candida] boidinii]|nr:hypothetical protein B5S29_g965 [[Candida] boidinii]